MENDAIVPIYRRTRTYLGLDARYHMGEIRHRCVLDILGGQDGSVRLAARRHLPYHIVFQWTS